MKATPILERCIRCPKCQNNTMRKAISYPKMGKEFFCDQCHVYFGLRELVNEWGYDVGDFGDTVSLDDKVDISYHLEFKEKPKNIGKALTWDDLANIYNKSTGRHARTMKMEMVFDWAERQVDKFFVDGEGSIHQILPEEKLVSTNWFDTMSVYPIDEPQFKSVSERNNAYAVVTRMFLGIPEWEDESIDYGSPILQYGMC